MDSMRSRSRRGAGPGGSTRRPPTGGLLGANAMLFHSTGQLARVCRTRVTWWCRASRRYGDGDETGRADDVIMRSCSPVRGLMSLVCAGPVLQVHTRRGAAQQPRAAAACAALPRVAAPHAVLGAGLGARVRRSLRCRSAHAIMASAAHSSVAAAGTTAVAEEPCFKQRGYRRPLHWVFKVGDLQANLDFYAKTMGLKARGGGRGNTCGRAGLRLASPRCRCTATRSSPAGVRRHATGHSAARGPKPWCAGHKHHEGRERRGHEQQLPSRPACHV